MDTKEIPQKRGGLVRTVLKMRETLPPLTFRTLSALLSLATTGRPTPLQTHLHPSDLARRDYFGVTHDQLGLRREKLPNCASRMHAKYSRKLAKYEGIRAGKKEAATRSETALAAHATTRHDTTWRRALRSTTANFKRKIDVVDCARSIVQSTNRIPPSLRVARAYAHTELLS